MTKYKFTQDFILPNAVAPLFKQGDVIEYDSSLTPLGGRTDGIYYIQQDTKSSSVTFIPLTYLTIVSPSINLTKSSVPYIVIGILVIGFISYKLYKKYK